MEQLEQFSRYIEQQGLDQQFQGPMKQIEQAREAQKKIGGIAPYLPQLKNRDRRLQEYEMSRINSEQTKQLGNFGLSQTYLTANKHSSRVVDISTLQPIYIREMMANKVNYGRYLVCRTIADPLNLVAISTLVEDEQGNIEDLSIYNYPHENEFRELFPKGTVIYIKEPNLKLGKDLVSRFMRVDSPSDLIIDDYQYSGKFQKLLRQLQKGNSPQELKTQGNTLFYNKKYELALRYYKVALNFEQTPALYSNCAAVLLSLELYSQAYIATQNALGFEDIPSNLQEKIYFRRGQAAYQMRQWSMALDNFEQCIKINPNNKEAQDQVTRTKTRINEQTNGAYDFVAISKQFDKTKEYNIDVSDYVNSGLRIQQSEAKGKYVVAYRDIQKGELLVVSKAFSLGLNSSTQKTQVMQINFISNSMDSPDQCENLKQLFQKVQGNPYLAKEIYSLYQKNLFDRNEVIPEHIVDIGKLEAISASNQFSAQDFTYQVIQSKLNDQDNEIQSTGLWIYPSLINHSCIANTTRTFIGDIMILTASQDIKANQEITVSYISYQDTYQERQSKFSSYGFQCTCELCELDKNDPQLIKRQQLVNKEFENIKQSNDYQKALKFLEKLKQTYSQRNQYQFLLLRPLGFITALLFRQGRYKQCANYLEDTFNIYNEVDNSFASFVALKIAQCYKQMFEQKKKKKWIDIAASLTIFNNHEYLMEKYA